MRYEAVPAKWRMMNDECRMEDPLAGRQLRSYLPHSPFIIQHSPLEAVMPACEREVVVGPYLDAELSDTARLEFEAHLLECATCREELERVREVARRLEPLRTLVLSPAEKVELARSVATAAAMPRGGEEDDGDSEPVLKIRPDRTLRWVRWVTAAAAAVFLFSVVQLFLAQRGANSTDHPGDPGGVPTWTPEPENKTPRHGGATTAPHTLPTERKSANPA